MSWLDSPRFVGLAVLGLSLFLVLVSVGTWARARRESVTSDQVEAGEPFWLREVPWYWFLLIYVAVIGLSLFALIRFVAS